MSVTALPARAGRRTSLPAGPGRSPLAGRRPAAAPAPAAVTAPSLTVTLAIPLSGEALSPEAYRLIDALRDLVERGNGTVTVAGDVPADAPADAGVALPGQRPARDDVPAAP